MVSPEYEQTLTDLAEKLVTPERFGAKVLESAEVKIDAK